MQNCLTTTTLPLSQRLDYWREIVDQHFVRLTCDLEPLKGVKKSLGLEANLNQSALGEFDLLEVKANPQTVTRHPGHRSSDDFFLFSLQLQGDCEIIQDNRKIIIKPGEMALYDTRRPYQVTLRDDFHMCTVKIPVDRLRLHLSNAEQCVARSVSANSYIGKVLGNLVYSLFDTPAPLSSQDQGALSRSLMEILTAGLRSVVPQHEDLNCSRLGQFHVDRIKHAIECSLGDPELSIERLAHGLKMSASSIHRAFEAEPWTVSEYLWDRRLDACREALLTPALAHRPIGDIAYSWGFTSHAHFSRMFKKRIGMTPKDYRSSQR